MKVLRTVLALSTTALVSLAAAAPANASTLIVNSTSVVYPTDPAVIAAIHLTSPATNYSSVYVSPQYLNGTLNGQAVNLFAYCVDILSESGPGNFNVVPLLTYLGGNTTQYNILAALIAEHGGPAGKYSDAAAQAAVWEAIYDTNPYNVASGTFSINNVQNDPTLLSDANSILTQAVNTAGTTGSDLQLFVAQNADRQDMLFWTRSAVPEPATWAMMLLGFGLIGGAMRSAKRRQGFASSMA